MVKKIQEASRLGRPAIEQRGGLVEGGGGARVRASVQGSADAYGGALAAQLGDEGVQLSRRVEAHLDRPDARVGEEAVLGSVGLEGFDDGQDP